MNGDFDGCLTAVADHDPNSFFANGALRGGQGAPTASGFAAPVLAATIWQTARRQGKRVVCATAVAADLASPDRSCDATIVVPRNEAPGAALPL